MNAEVSTAVASASSTAVSLAAISTAVENFNRIAAGLAALQAKYGGVLYDCKTYEGMDAARKAKREVAKPRIELEACRVDAKKPILKLGRDLDTEAAKVAAAISKIEDPIALQIKTEEDRQQREKDEAAAKELARVTAIRERIEKMRTAPQRAVEGRLNAEKLAEWAGKLEVIAVDDTFAEFQREAEDAKVATLARLRELHAATVDREAEAVRLEQQRQEQARIAEAQRVEQARLDGIRRDQEAAQAAEDKRLADARAEQDRAAKAEQDRQAAVQKKMDDDAAALAERQRQFVAAEAERARIAALPPEPAKVPKPSTIAPATPAAQIAQLRAALRDLLECVQDASATDLMPDAEPYKAEAVWDDVLARARLALRTTDPKEP